MACAKGMPQKRSSFFRVGAGWEGEDTAVRVIHSRSKAAQSAALQKSLQNRLELVEDFQLVGLESVDSFYLSAGGFALEPTGGAPWVLASQRNESVFHGVLMDVVEPGEVALLEGQLRLPEVMPDFAIGRVVETVDIAGGFLVELGQKRGKALSAVFSSFRRVSDEVVVVGKHSPGFQEPLVLSCIF